MSKTAIVNIVENDFDDWRQMFMDFANLHGVTPTPEGLARTWCWLCDPTHPETGLIVRVGDKVVGFVHYRLQPSALRDTQILYLDALFVTETHRGSGVADDIIGSLTLDCTRPQLFRHPLGHTHHQRTCPAIS